MSVKKSEKLKKELSQAKKRSAQYKKQIKKLTAELGKKDNDFQTVAENSPDVICRFSKNFQHLYVNPALEKTTGFPASNFIGKTPHQAGLSADFADFWVANIKVVFDNASPHSTEFSFPTPTGEQYFHTLLVPEFDGTGNVQTVLTMTRNITEMRLKQTMQEELLGIASHELKTPLTSLKALTQILHSKFISQQDIDSAGYLTKMQNQVEKMNNLINDLLDTTRVNAGAFKFTSHKFNFDAVVLETVEEMQCTTNQHEILIKGQTDKYVMADKNKICQVLINLLSNAIKYSPDADRIIIQLISNADGVMCWVQDFGIGIPKEKQAKVFERFYRIAQDRDGAPTGLGLGLYISAEIIERHGGKIWVDSQEGRGSTFCFTLPASGGQDSITFDPALPGRNMAEEDQEAV